MSATRNKLLARLHCIKKEHGWDDETYRAILEARTGKRSAADLSSPALARAVAALGTQKPKGAYKRANEWAFIDQASVDRQPLLRKICAVCLAMKVGKSYAEGAARRANGLPDGITVRLELLDVGQLWKTAGALSRTQQWGGPKAEAETMQQRADTARRSASEGKGVAHD